jgi:hypothetical protein
MNATRVRTNFKLTRKLSPHQLGIAILPINDFIYKSYYLVTGQEVIYLLLRFIFVTYIIWKIFLAKNEIQSKNSIII